jgi:presenilin-like A22 family membrane protease
MIKVIGNRGILEIITIFSIVMFVGILISVAAVRTGSVSIINDTLENPKFVILSYVLDATLLLIVSLLILRRHGHHSNTLLFEMLEGIVISFTSSFVFLLLVAILLPQYVTNGLVYIIAAAMAIALVGLKDEFHKLRDFATVVSSIGVGLILGLNFAFGIAIAILAIVAVYDYIGVFKSNEMVTLAKAFSESDVSFLISIADLEAVPKWGLSNKDIESYMSYLGSIHELNDPKFKSILQKGELPVVCQLSLGEGDLSLPLMVAISAYLTVGASMSAMVIMGSLVGIFTTMLILKIYKHPIPAVPPLFACIGIFVGIACVFTKIMPGVWTIGLLLIVVSAVVMLIDILTVTSRMHKNRLEQQAAAAAQKKS